MPVRIWPVVPIMGRSVKTNTKEVVQQPLTIELTRPQQNFFLSEHRYTAFVGGFGSGKSQSLFVKMLADKFQFPDINLLYAAPTYSLIRDIAFDRLQNMLDRAPVRYNLNKAENILEIENYGKILFRTLESPERLVGFEVFRIYVDELDTLRATQAEEAWNKLIGRCRQRSEVAPSAKNQIFVATTPEGFRFVYDRWIKRKTDDYTVIHAPTTSNPYLPEGYIESLRSSYPAELIDAYIEGQFVNLTSKTVYSAFNRRFNDCDETYFPYDILHIGMDFNVLNMNAVVHVIRGEKVFAIAEITGVENTPAMINTLAEIYRTHFPQKMVIYPDAYANAQHASNQNSSQTDHALLRGAGLTLDAPSANPSIKDRVQSMNHMFCDGTGNRRYYVNTTKCPNYTLALEQQVYDLNGMPVKDKSNNWDDIVDAAGYFISRKYPIIRERFSQGIVRNY